jgi:hypothetical protein
MQKGVSGVRCRASWVSAYALTNDYTAGAAHFVRLGSRSFHDVRGRSKTFFLQDFRVIWSSLAQGLEYPWNHVADVVRR